MAQSSDPTTGMKETRTLPSSDEDELADAVWDAYEARVRERISPRVPENRQKLPLKSPIRNDVA
jgi:hypothetical protein